MKAACRENRGRISYYKLKKRILFDKQNICHANLEYVLELFGNSVRSGRSSYGKFVKKAKERLDRKYRLKSEGYYFEVRNIVCYWVSRELGISQVSLARKFGVSQPAICAAIQRGEKIVYAKKLQLE